MVKLILEGMHCPSCAVDIDLALEDLNGISNSDTSYAKSQMTITYDSDQVELSDIQAEIKKMGYLTHLK